MRGEVEVLDAFEVRELGELQVERYALVVARTDLAIEERAQEMGVAPLLGGGLLGEAVELSGGGKLDVTLNFYTTLRDTTRLLDWPQDLERDDARK